MWHQEPFEQNKFYDAWAFLTHRPILFQCLVKLLYSLYNGFEDLLCLLHLTLQLYLSLFRLFLHDCEHMNITDEYEISFLNSFMSKFRILSFLIPI